jgi:diguanylate cyclase (GGDEF)-like protein
VADGPTIGVLSTWFGGSYFGPILAGMSRVTAARGGRLIAIQTLDAGTISLDLAEPPAYRRRVAWEQVSAFAVILNAVDGAYLNAARDTGKPIVMISDDVPGFVGPIVQPDNAPGVHESIDHLYRHGHRRIAFAGNPVHRDLRERFDAYRHAMREHGLEPDPALLFHTGNNQVSGGEVAARAMIAAGLPSTAVVTGNDLNAIGLTRVLLAAGYQLPRDQAVVGFDDMDEAAFYRPSLSSVRQPFDAVGGLAVELLLRALDGEPLPPERHYVPTRFVARESCGCPSTLRFAGTKPAAPVASERDLLDQLGRALTSGDQPRSGDASSLAAAARMISQALRAAVDDRPEPDVAAMQRVLTDLYLIKPHPENLIAAMRCVRWFGAHLIATEAADEATRQRVRDCVEELILALANVQVTVNFQDAVAVKSAYMTQYAVSLDLLRSHEEDPRTLGWLTRRPEARGGCLGLWPAERPDAGDVAESEADDPGLDVFWPAPPGSAPTAQQCRVSEFPPADLIALLDRHPDTLVFVVPMKIDGSDRGMLAVVAPIEARLSTGREGVNQWTAMFTIALDHQAVLESLRVQQELLRRAALYDQLTGLPNRSLFLDRLGQAIDRTVRYPDFRFAVLMLDLDGFKVVNDSLGHLAGDRLLIEIAGRLHVNLRRLDVAARFGGDEFAVLLDGIESRDTPLHIAERLHKVVDEPVDLGGQEVFVSASIGIAFGDEGCRDAEDLLRNADTAMYDAKSREKGTHAVFDVTMHAKAVDRLRTEAGLRQALDRDEFEVHYQPIVELATGRTGSYEALVRWRHPTRGLLPPGDFLQIAEESGLILPIGRWLCDVAFHQLRDWQTRYGVPRLRMAVNVSNRQFWHAGLLDELAASLRAAGLDARHVDIEVTEGLIMHDAKLAGAKLDDLHDLGFAVHIDDFGTGYSSLESLHRLPIDALKIDRSFVGQLGVDRRCDEIVRTIAAMGANLGLDIVAEGIETPAQLARLRDLGCHYGQGYLFSPPVPAADTHTVDAQW